MLVQMLFVNTFSVNYMLLVENIMLYYSKKKKKKKEKPKSKLDSEYFIKAVININIFIEF